MSVLVLKPTKYVRKYAHLTQTALIDTFTAHCSILVSIISDGLKLTDYNAR